MDTNVVEVCGFIKKISKEEFDFDIDEELSELLLTYFRDGSNYHPVFDRISKLMKEDKIKPNSLTIFMAEITKTENYYTDKPKEIKLK